MKPSESLHNKNLVNPSPPGAFSKTCFDSSNLKNQQWKALLLGSVSLYQTILTELLFLEKVKEFSPILPLPSQFNTFCICWENFLPVCFFFRGRGEACALTAHRPEASRSLVKEMELIFHNYLLARACTTKAQS